MTQVIITTDKGVKTKTFADMVAAMRYQAKFVGKRGVISAEYKQV